MKQVHVGWIRTHASGKSIDLVLNALPPSPLEIYIDRKLK